MNTPNRPTPIVLDATHDALVEDMRPMAARLVERVKDVVPGLTIEVDERTTERLSVAVALAAQALDEPERLEELAREWVPFLRDVGLTPRHFKQLAGDIAGLVAALAAEPGIPADEDRWSRAASTIVEKITREITSPADESTATREEPGSSSSPDIPDAEAIDDLLRIKAAVDTTTTAIMQIDRGFVVTYVNDATRKLFADNATTFRSLCPDTDFDSIEGSRIDIFHRDPERQREFLADPSNLPYRTDIHYGDRTFELRVSAIVDGHGAYVGNNLEWKDVSAARASALDAARQRTAVDDASSNAMMTDLEPHIIGVIDEIAFQTNLLAFNAAVQAAHAGEQGLGFALVVADARNLAQRSANAAQEIQDMINDAAVATPGATAMSRPKRAPSPAPVTSNASNETEWADFQATKIRSGH